MLPVVVCGTLLRQYVICFFVAAPCVVEIPEVEQNADDPTVLNLDTAPACDGTTCIIQSSSSITMQDTSSFCAPSATGLIPQGFSLYHNGQCLWVHIPNLPNSDSDLVVASGYDVVYTCTNGNLEAAVPLEGDPITGNPTPYTLDQVTGIRCGDTC